MKRLILILALTVSAEALAGTDYVCFATCSGEGVSYGLCEKRCDDGAPSLSDRTRQLKPKSTDYQCLADCLAAYSYGLCENKCSY